MPTMPDMIAKPTFFSRLEEASRQRKTYDLQQIINELKNLPPGTDFVDVGLKYKWITPAEATHLRMHWLNKPPGQGWWPSEPVEDILHTALTKTVELVQQYDRPIDAFWLCTEPFSANPPPGTSFGQLYAFHAVSPLQITLVFTTPSPNMKMPTATGTIPDMWVTEKAPTGKGAVVRQAMA